MLRLPSHFVVVLGIVVWSCSSNEPEQRSESRTESPTISVPPSASAPAVPDSSAPPTSSSPGGASEDGGSPTADAAVAEVDAGGGRNAAREEARRRYRGSLPFEWVACASARECTVTEHGPCCANTAVLRRYVRKVHERFGFSTCDMVCGPVGRPLCVRGVCKAGRPARRDPMADP